MKSQPINKNQLGCKASKTPMKVMILMNHRLHDFIEILGNKFLVLNKSDEINIIYIYRWLSWFLTSLFYLLGNNPASFSFKVIVILLLLVAAKLITDLYIRYRSSINKLKSLILIETVLITFLLIPTGGITSPFIWYALNPLLVATSFLPAFFCWFTAGFYIVTGSGISVILYSEETITSFFYSNSHLILVFILITAAVQLLSMVTQELKQQKSQLEAKGNQLLDAYNQLDNAKRQSQKSLEHIISLYQILNTITDHYDINKLVQNVAYYAGKLTNSPSTFFWLPALEKTDTEQLTIISENNMEKESFKIAINNIWENYKYQQGSTNVSMCNKTFMIVFVKSSTKHYGILGVEAKPLLPWSNPIKNQNEILLTFLSDFSSVILQRLHYDETVNNLLITEEQNRIANEIHDKVSQLLFSVTCSLHSLTKKHKDLSKEAIQKQLELSRNTTNQAMQELRSSIYHLSSKKNNHKSFLFGLKSYLQNISSLNEVKIAFNFNGDESLLSWQAKKALLRIIPEAVGNAIRHGNSRNITVTLSIENKGSELIVMDNGQGFNMYELNKLKDKGLGISNIYNLVNSLQGTINITSNADKGTELKITFLNSNIQESKLEGLYESSTC